MQIITHKRHPANIGQSERMASAIAGGLLAAIGVQRRSPGGLALALVGGDLIRRAVTGHSNFYELVGVRTAPVGQGASVSVPYELGVRVDRSIAIGRPRAEVFRFWRNLSNLPRFMSHVRAIENLSSTRSHWLVQAPMGNLVSWDALIHNEIEGELIAWRSVPGGDVDHAGSVRFEDDPGGCGTVIKVELQYNPPVGIVGAIFAAFWGEEPSLQIAEDLQRLKRILESRNEQDAMLDETVEESFPASDAPAYGR